jgi:deferrochelatase/peroxidase EfeB
MQPEFEVRTPSLAASTELLVMAPIRAGFVPSLDTVTYKSRVQTLLKQLHAGRQGLHEYRPLRAVSDAVERVGVIRSLRVAVVEGRSDADDRILLSVHFDGSYEAYARTIWQRAARLLDLIFCNSEAYVTGWDHSFDDWSAWIRSVQVPTPFFYASPGLTFQDQTYLLMHERRDRGGLGDEAARTRIAVPTAEEIAWSILSRELDPTKRDDEQSAEGSLVRTEKFRQNLGALAALYRLADWYRPGTPDGDVLRNAAHELLPQLVDAFDSAGHNRSLAEAVGIAAGPQLAKPLGWFLTGLDDVPRVRGGTELPEKSPQPQPTDDVQGGILAPFEGATDGAMVLLAFDGPAAASAFLGGFQTTTRDGTDTPADTQLVNLALTLEGLRTCGLTAAQLDAWPPEFRQGMAARAGLLGDVRWNHPRRWVLPRRNGGLQPNPARDDSGLASVPLESVHAIVQLRRRPLAGRRSDAVAAITAAIERLPRDFSGVTLLSVQWLARQFHGTDTVDHFGYMDGKSQPTYDRPTADSPYSNQVHLGEVLLGYPNAADRECDLAVNRDPELGSLMRNGSFLVVRKLRQDVAGFSDAVKQAAGATGIADAEIRARMMGRWPADAADHRGEPLAEMGSGGINDFDYRGDEHGETTPLAAHIRRANPRSSTLDTDFPKPPPGGRPPRIVRRSLSYGPSAPTDGGGDELDRGLVFMAYNASIAEQFEVIQGWLAGGNSSRGYSGAACPFLGVPEAGRKRNFRFLHGTKTVHMTLDGSDDLGAEPKPLVSLQWGLYAFAPSRSAQARLAEIAKAAGATAALPWSVDRGQQLIDRLQRKEADAGPVAGAAAWKAALEDPEPVARFDSASIWAAVRQLHGGSLRIPYGILVATPELVDEVLRDETRYTVSGYRRRLVAAGMGPIFLGRDADDPDYARLSAACNRAVEDIGMAQAFSEGRNAALALLDSWLGYAEAIARDNGDSTWEASVDPRELVAQTLANLCETWFGLNDTTPAKAGGRPLFQRGVLDWEWQPGDPVFYPGHFTAASRATFQPEPSAEVMRLAAEHGHALTSALTEFITTLGAKTITAPVTRAVLDSLWEANPQDAVHTIAGALMGFLPTTEGVLRRVLTEWTRDGTLLELNGRVQGAELTQWETAGPIVSPVLRRAMKFRPVPEQIWREAKTAHRLEGASGTSIEVHPGDKLVLGQVSATHAQLEQGKAADVFAMFGGHRGEGQPTHACPGYGAAIGAMVGLVTALVGPSRGGLAPSTAGVLVFRGTTQHPVEQATPSWQKAMFVVGPGNNRRLLGFGDSWLRFQIENSTTGSDLMRALADLGYDTRNFAPNDSAKQGYRLALMAEERPSNGKSIYGSLRKLVKDGTPPFAVLLGAGGNDFIDGVVARPWISCRPNGTGSVLDRVLNPKGATPAHDQKHLNDFLVSMTGHLTFIVTELARAGGGIGSPTQVPIVVHAYDHPWPNGEKYISLMCPWLEPSFARKGYTSADLTTAAGLMSTFIDQLNDAYAHTINTLAGTGIRVTFVRLTGVLAATTEYKQFGFKAVWKNEMHPNKTGFAALAAHLHTYGLMPLVPSLPVI